MPSLLQGCGEWAFVAAGEADQSFGVLFEFLCRDCAFAFLRAQLHFGDQAAEVLIAGAGGTRRGRRNSPRRRGGTRGMQLLIFDC